MLRLDYEALADASRTLIEQGDIFEDCINTMTNTVNGLPDHTGQKREPCDRYVEQYITNAKVTLNESRKT